MLFYLWQATAYKKQISARLQLYLLQETPTPNHHFLFPPKFPYPLIVLTANLSIQIG